MDTESVDTSKNVLHKLEYDDVLDMLKKYGYSSASSHPYMYQNGDDLGICYSYRDADYGTLERIKLFDDIKSVEEFLKQMQWLEKNGPQYHVRMSLDNYETVYPRILFLRKERLMVPGEMDDIETFDFNEQKRINLDDTSRLLYEAGDLLIVYDEIKARQLAYFDNLTVIKNSLRKKYYDLQLEVDKYNRIGKVERSVTYVPPITDTGIDLTMEIAIKDRYNQYVAQTPSYEDVLALIKEIWELNKNLELNDKYYEVQIEDNNIRNEIKVVEAKLELMKDLNDDVKPLFGVDLMSKFRKINRDFAKKSNVITEEYIQNKLKLVDKKYSVFNQLDLLDLSEYLREGFTNTNYDDMVSRYAKNRARTKNESIRLPLNEVAADLSVQYKEKLDPSEQAILILHNNPKYREIFDAILQVDNFDTIPVKQVVKKISGIKGFSKLKSECFDALKKRIADPVNANIKTVLFPNTDFTSFETFISGFIPLLVKLKNMNGRMVLNSDINMYSLVNKIDDIIKQKFTFITNDLDNLYVQSQAKKCNIALILLKKDLPVLYAPYTFDLGDIYTKNGSPQMYIKEYVGFDLLVEHDDMNLIVSEDKINVVNYQSEKEVIENLTTAISLYNAYKTTFCKLMFVPKEIEALEEVPAEVVPEVVPVETDIPAPPVVLDVPSTPVEENAGTVSAVVSPIPVVPNMEEVAPVQPVPEVVQSIQEVQPVVEVEQPTPQPAMPDNMFVSPSVTEKKEESIINPTVAPIVTIGSIDEVPAPVLEEKKEEPIVEIPKEEPIVPEVEEPKKEESFDLPKVEEPLKEEKKEEETSKEEEVVIPSSKEESKIDVPSPKEDKKDLPKEVKKEEEKVAPIPEEKQKPLITPKEEKKEVPKESNLPKVEEKKETIPPEGKIVTKVVDGVVKKVRIIPKKPVESGEVKNEVKPVTSTTIKEDVKKVVPKPVDANKVGEAKKPVVVTKSVVKEPVKEVSSTSSVVKGEVKKVVTKPVDSNKPGDVKKPVALTKSVVKEPIKTDVKPSEEKKVAITKPVVSNQPKPVGVKPMETKKPVVTSPVATKPVSKTVSGEQKPTQVVKPVEPNKVDPSKQVVKTKVVITPDGKKIVKKVIVSPNKSVQSTEKPVQSNIVKKPAPVASDRRE